MSAVKWGLGEGGGGAAGKNGGGGKGEKVVSARVAGSYKSGEK